MSNQVFDGIMHRLRSDQIFRETFMGDPASALAEYQLTPEQRLRFLLPNFSWLVEGKLAGGGQPSGDEAFVTLKKHGIGSILTLTEKPLPPDLVAKYGFQTAHLPLADFTAPTLEQVAQAMTTITEFEKSGGVVVHCAAGLGRTGTILACYLVRQGWSAQDAIDHVRAKRPGSIETLEQEAVIKAYEQRLTHPAS